MNDTRRLYIASPSCKTNPSDFEIEDEDRLRREADWSDGLPHERFGLPRFAETPKVKVALENKPADFYGYDRWILSSRAKELLERMDAEAFDFVRCDTTAPPRHDVDTYWMGRVRRVIEDFDRDASVFEMYGKQWDILKEEWVETPTIKQLDELTLLPGHEDHLAFYLRHHSTYPILDGKIVDVIRAEKLRGLDFAPLQPPTKIDAKS